MPRVKKKQEPKELCWAYHYGRGGQCRRKPVVRKGQAMYCRQCAVANAQRILGDNELWAMKVLAEYDEFPYGGGK